MTENLDDAEDSGDDKNDQNENEELDVSKMTQSSFDSYMKKKFGEQIFISGYEIIE
jgi:hypothetical protein